MLPTTKIADNDGMYFILGVDGYSAHQNIQITTRGQEGNGPNRTS